MVASLTFVVTVVTLSTRVDGWLNADSAALLFVATRLCGNKYYKCLHALLGKLKEEMI